MARLMVRFHQPLMLRAVTLQLLLAVILLPVGQSLRVEAATGNPLSLDSPYLSPSLRKQLAAASALYPASEATVSVKAAKHLPIVRPEVSLLERFKRQFWGKRVAPDQIAIQSPERATSKELPDTDSGNGQQVEDRSALENKALSLMHRQSTMHVAAVNEQQSFDDEGPAISMHALALESLVEVDEVPQDSVPPKSKPTPLQQTAAFGFSVGNTQAPKQFQTRIQQTQPHIELITGKSEIIDLDEPAMRVSISNPEVASAVVISPRQVQLIGNATGVTSLTVWPDGESGRYQHFDISVRRDVSLLQDQLEHIAPDVLVTPMIARDTVILTGETSSQEQAQLAVQIAKAFYSQAASASPAAAPSAGAAAPSAGGSPVSAGVGSNTPGSSAAGADNSVINLIHVKGMPRTKLELVKQKMAKLNANIELEIVPGPDGSEKAILSGRVPSTGMISKAINIASVFYGQPGIKVITGPGGNGVRDTGSEDFHTAEAFSDNMDVNLLQGVVMTDTSGNVVSLLEVDQKPQVRCHIKVLDVSKNVTDQLGIPLATINSGGGIVVQNDFTPLSAPIANANGLNNLPGATVGVRRGDLNLTLQALEQKQLVRSLAEPTLLTMSGEKASFLAGGEIPVPISDANGRITLEYKEFGIRVNLIATVTDEGKIHLQVAPEVSSIDPTLAFESQFITIPGIRSRRLQTTVEILPGQSFMLGGLYNSEDTESLSKFPYLSNLPVIGRFLSSNLEQKTKSELIILIQPEVVTSDSLSAKTN